jgi:uncharacterized paraquat-inducible protein A
MQLDEITVAVLLIWLLMIGVAGVLVGWNWTLLAVGVGVLVGVEAAVASERARLRLRPPRRSQQERALKTRCPTCGAAVSTERAICPRCLADLKVNCPECGAVVEANASRCPACQRALPSKPRTPFSG